VIICFVACEGRLMGAFTVFLLVGKVSFSVVLYSWVCFVIWVLALCVEPCVRIFCALVIMMPLQVIWCVVPGRRYDLMPSPFLRDDMNARMDAMSACIVVIFWSMVSCCLLSSPLMEAKSM